MKKLINYFFFILFSIVNLIFILFYITFYFIGILKFNEEKIIEKISNFINNFLNYVARIMNKKLENINLKNENIDSLLKAIIYNIVEIKIKGVKSDV